MTKNRRLKVDINYIPVSVIKGTNNERYELIVYFVSSCYLKEFDL